MNQALYAHMNNKRKRKKKKKKVKKQPRKWEKIFASHLSTNPEYI
jgi:hypothetical protein